MEPRPLVPSAAGGPLTILFDGDDTLWDNNTYFERAIEAFVGAVRWGDWTDAAVRDELDRVEEANFAAGGGKAGFGRNLRLAAAAIVPGDRLDAALARCDAIVDAMPTTEVQPFEDVIETLDALGARHELGLVTRGEPAEQWAKIDASGLRDRFARIAVVAGKVPGTYRGLVEAWSLDPGRTWMIGNSPRSDILPARAAGLRAVLVTHASTWRLEHVALDPDDDGVVTISRFRDLAVLF